MGAAGLVEEPDRIKEAVMIHDEPPQVTEVLPIEDVHGEAYKCPVCEAEVLVLIKDGTLASRLHKIKTCRTEE